MRLQVNDTTGGIVGNAVLTADNANTVNGVARVNFASGATTPVALEFVGGEYYAKSSVDPFTPDAFPNGSTAAQVSQGGINIGTLANDYAGQFRNDAQVVVRYKVRFAEIENPPLPPDDTNVCTGAAALSLVPTVSTVYPGGVAQYRAIYDSNGACAGGQTDVTNVASWTADNTALATSLGRGVFRGVAAGNTTVRASYGTYGANAALTVRTTTGGTTTTNPRGSYSGGGGSTYTPRTGGSSYNSGTTTTNVPPVTNNPGTTHIYYPKRVANSVR
jgi:hypothetical protein